MITDASRHSSLGQHGLIADVLLTFSARRGLLAFCSRPVSRSKLGLTSARPVVRRGRRVPSAPPGVRHGRLAPYQPRRGSVHRAGAGRPGTAPAVVRPDSPLQALNQDGQSTARLGRLLLPSGAGFWAGSGWHCHLALGALRADHGRTGF
jgi:hypothetical protein